MSIWGSLLGGIVGFSFGGPIGALIGSMIGGRISSSRRGTFRQGFAQQQQIFAISLIILAAKLAKGIITIEINANFQFWKNITVKRPISVKVSLNKFNKAVLIKLVINPTSKLKFAKNSPVCLLSIVCVSTFINDFTKSTWTFFVTS